MNNRNQIVSEKLQYTYFYSMPSQSRPSFCFESDCLPQQARRNLFKKADSNLLNLDNLFKPKKSHFRHSSQPQEIDYKQAETDTKFEVVQSIQEILRKAKKQGSHLRVMSEMSQTAHHPTMKQKYNQFQYNKWYIKPEFRLKRPTLNKTNYQNRFSQTDFVQNQNGFHLGQTHAMQLIVKPDIFGEKQHPNVAFAKDFAHNHDKKSLTLLKEFKRKNAFRKGRTPQLVDLILQVNKPKNDKNKNDIRNPSKMSSMHRENTGCSKSVSKFYIEDSDSLQPAQNKNKTVLIKPKKRITLLQTHYAKIKEEIHRNIRNDQTYDGIKIGRFPLR